MSKAPVTRINVSDLHLCRRCPRLLAWKRSGQKNAWTVGRKGRSFCGNAFHDHIAAPFHQDAAGQNGMKKRLAILEVFQNNPHNADTMKNALRDCVYRNYFSPYLDTNSRTLKTSQIVSLGDILVRWSDFLVDFFHANSGFQDNPEAFTEQAFWVPERSMKANYTAPDGTVLIVSGRFDSALWDRSNNEVLLVEYKCLKETDPTVELAQIALYAWLLREHTGLSPRADVLYLEEENPLASYSAINTAAVILQLPFLFNTTIQVIRAVKSNKESIPKTDNPSLCKKCPYHKDCDTRFGS